MVPTAPHWPAWVGLMVTTHFDLEGPILAQMSQISMALFLWDIFCVRNIALWGVQSITTERPAHPALLQPIWNHPVRENGQKQTPWAKIYPFWPS